MTDWNMWALQPERARRRRNRIMWASYGVLVAVFAVVIALAPIPGGGP